MKAFIKHLLSEEGSVSSMRLAFLCWMTCVTFTFCICIFIVVVKKGDFPTDMWKAIAGLCGTGGIGFIAKIMQKRTETSSSTSVPPPPGEGSEPS